MLLLPRTPSNLGNSVNVVTRHKCEMCWIGMQCGFGGDCKAMNALRHHLHHINVM